MSNVSLAWDAVGASAPHWGGGKGSSPLPSADQPASRLAGAAPYRVRPLGGWGAAWRAGERDGGALILTGASPGSGMKAEGGSQSARCLFRLGSRAECRASGAPAAQGSPGRRRAAEPVAGHAPDSGPLHPRRRPEPAGQTPARLGPPAPRPPGAATPTLGVRPTISAQTAPSAPAPAGPAGPGESERRRRSDRGRKEGREEEPAREP